MPIKCPGAPQKIAYLADDAIKRDPAIAAKSKVIYATATPGIFGVPTYAAPCVRWSRGRASMPATPTP